MSDFVQLREDTNFKENETMVEGMCSITVYQGVNKLRFKSKN